MFAKSAVSPFSKSYSKYFEIQPANRSNGLETTQRKSRNSKNTSQLQIRGACSRTLRLVFFLPKICVIISSYAIFFFLIKTEKLILFRINALSECIVEIQVFAKMQSEEAENCLSLAKPMSFFRADGIFSKNFRISTRT